MGIKRDRQQQQKTKKRGRRKGEEKEGGRRGKEKERKISPPFVSNPPLRKFFMTLF